MMIFPEIALPAAMKSGICTVTSLECVEGSGVEGGRNIRVVGLVV